MKSINLARIDFAGTSGGGGAKPEEVFEAYPTTVDQIITPTPGSVFSGGTVHAVTADIDENIVAGNIKEGVTILGIEGSLKGEKPEEVFDVQPTTADQTITPTEGSVFSSGTVRAVTSSIDGNIQPENIKEGVTILGVEGTLEEGITPEGTKTITDNGTYDVTTFASVDVEVSGDTPDYRYMKGTVDRAGLRAIGWTDEDILTYEQNTPHYNWQNDQFTVSEENKALYQLDDPRPSLYKDDPRVTFVPNKNMESYFAKYNAFANMKYIKGIPWFDTSSVTNVGYMFSNCSALTTIPQLDTSSATDMDHMFNECSALTTIPQLDTSSATRMINMFNGCKSLTTIPQLDTSSVTYMGGIFYGCSALTTIPQLNTSNVTSMDNMFYDCTRLTTIPQLDTSKVTNMNSMFYYCTRLTTIPQLDTSKVTDMNSMFYDCTRLTTIPQLDTSKVTDMKQMLAFCNDLTTVEGIDFSGFTSNVTQLFGSIVATARTKLTRFIVNGKINVSISDGVSIKLLTKIDYDSVKSILAAASRTDNTNAKTLAFNRTMSDPDGELQNIITICTGKGWTITGLTLN